MIKYLGSKRNLLPVLSALAQAAVSSGAHTALDLFTGTTRVAQAFKRAGLCVTANDCASYAYLLAQTYVATDAARVDQAALREALADMDALPGRDGYVTQVFCEEARFFHPKNGRRIDAIRDEIERSFADTPLYPLLLTALLLAADRVDSTTGQQMAYLKSYAPRALRDLELRMPDLLTGEGFACCEDAGEYVQALAAAQRRFDLVYLDPPYNQHRYFTNYHIWETLVRWDAPEYYGVACKRVDARDAETKSVFNSRRTMPAALCELLRALRSARTLVVSHNNESWVSAAEIAGWLEEAGFEAVAVFNFAAKRYVGASIGVYNPEGRKVGTPGHTSNIEHLIVGSSAEMMQNLKKSLQLL
jgi:adenine-specific DNA-methyltransferase